VSAAETKASARVELGGGGATVSTGLPVLDHLVGELARCAPADISVEVAPDSVDRAVPAAGSALGAAFRPLLHADGASGHGSAWLSADEALAGAIIETADRPLVASNVDFSGQRVGGLGSDVVARFIDGLAEGAGLNVHIRVLEGKDPENVLRAIFKALGAAIGQACRTPEGGEP
jgi:imidazoleglycerol-phosphate dehydratase